MDSLEIRVTELEKRVDNLTALLKNAFGDESGKQAPTTSTTVSNFKRKPYATISYNRMHFFFRKPGFQYMESIIDDLKVVLASKCTPSNDINIWIDFTSGVRFDYPEFEQFPPGRKNLFIILSYKSNVRLSSTEREAYRYAQQVNLQLMDNFKSIDYSKSYRQIEELCDGMRD